jgi:hypothetical protein
VGDVGADLADEVGSGAPFEDFEVDGRDQMRPIRAARTAAERAERGFAHRPECVEAAPAGGTDVACARRIGRGVQRGPDHARGLGVDEAVEAVHAVQQRGEVQVAARVLRLRGSRAAVAVQRVAECPDDRAELARVRLAGDVHQLGLDVEDRGLSRVGARIGHHSHVLAVDDTRGERGRGLGELLELARQPHRRRRGTVGGTGAMPQPRRHRQCAVVHPCARPVERAHGAQPFVLDPLAQARQADHIGRGLARRELVDRCFELVQRVEHMFASYEPRSGPVNSPVSPEFSIRVACDLTTRQL